MACSICGRSWASLWGLLVCISGRSRICAMTFRVSVMTFLGLSRDLSSELPDFSGESQVQVTKSGTCSTEDLSLHIEH